MDLSGLDFRQDKEDCSYHDDGLLYCDRCGECLQTQFDISGAEDIVTITANCDCRAAAIEEQAAAYQEMQKKRRIRELRIKGIIDSLYREHTFGVDDSPASTGSLIARQYVRNWEKMKDKGIGLALYGAIGTGKSFYAACIANALIDQGVAVQMTSFARILAQAMDLADKNKWQRHLRTVPLLIIDDVGTERQTDYALEIVYSVVDDRVKSGKPLIITTNLSQAEMKSVDNLVLKRVYDRILLACPLEIVLKGESRRIKSRSELQKDAMKLLFE